jgi:hypothetical protein
MLILWVDSVLLQNYDIYVTCSQSFTTQKIYTDVFTAVRTSKLVVSPRLIGAFPFWFDV